MPYNENPDAVKQLLRDREKLEADYRQQRRLWRRSHMTLFYIVLGIVVAAMVFFGIKWYNDSHNPFSRFISASGKTIGTPCSFHVTATKNDDLMMRYDGTLKVDPSAQRVTAAYDADNTSYRYRGVVYTDGAESYKGAFYDGKWTTESCTERVREFFDFYNDYKGGVIDCGSFLRFTELNTVLYADELERFVDMVRSRLSGDSEIATITTVNNPEDGSTTYHYTIDLAAFFELVRTKGASIFYNSPDYNRFVSRLNANRENIANAACSLDFTVDASGYLSDLQLRIGTGSDVYVIHIAMDSFGSAVPDIPDDFYEAAGIQKPQ